MKKLLFLLALSLVLVGCQPQDPTSKTTADTAQTQSELGANAQTGQEAQQEFSQIAAAIKSGQPVACTMTNTKTAQKMEYKVKGKKMKMLASSPEGTSEFSGNMISDGEFIFTWTDKDKKGIKMRLPSQEELKNMTDKSTTPPDLSQESEKKRYEDMGFVIDCKPMMISDSEFVPPTDVSFTDMSEVMNNALKMMKKE